MEEKFRLFTRKIEQAVGSPWAFFAAIVSVIVWAVVGPYFEWSDAHQLFINTATTIVTFLFMFILQATQTRDTLALHLKLSELIRVSDARNSLIAAQDLDEASLDAAKNQIKRKTTLPP